MQTDYYPYLLHFDSAGSKNSFLINWQQDKKLCKFQLWNYSCSHSILQIRIDKNEEYGNLHIICEGCYSINSPAFYSNCHLQISSNENPGSEGRFLIFDEASDLQVFCDKVSIAENVEPVFWKEQDEQTDSEPL